MREAVSAAAAPAAFELQTQAIHPTGWGGTGKVAHTVQQSSEEM